MKRFYLLLVLVLSLGTVRAQTSPFIFQALPGQPYSDLTGAASVNNGALWNSSSSFPLSLGFTFPFHGRAITSINVLARGVQFVGSSNMYMFVYNTPFGGNLIQDRGIISNTTSLSPISYQVTGSPGSRIGKIEWRNAGPAKASPAPINPAEFLNCQLWLFEQTGQIEVHFGTSSTTPDTFQNSAIFLKTFFNSLLAVAPIGAANNPSYQVDNCALNTVCYGGNITGVPANGMVYQFTPNPAFITAATSAKTDLQLQAFPNPASDRLSVQLGSSHSVASLRVLDGLGRIVRQVSLTSASESNLVFIPTSTLSAGVYTLQACALDGRLLANQRLLIQH